MTNKAGLCQNNAVRPEKVCEVWRGDIQATPGADFSPTQVFKRERHT